jgi:uncharacterized UBP type Zn finger protein
LRSDGRFRVYASTTLRHLASSTVSISLTGDGVDEESGFSLDALVARSVARAAVKAPAADERAEPEISLNDCFAFFSQPAVLDEQNQWFCPHCRQFVCAEKQMHIWSAPQILVIQLKRFITVGRHQRKLDRRVDYPLRLDMAPFLAGPQNAAPCKYRLFAVSEHSGSLAGGHYTAHAVVLLEGGTRRWFSFNDSCARQASERDAQSDEAYLLFYERDEEDGSDGEREEEDEEEDSDEDSDSES